MSTRSRAFGTAHAGAAPGDHVEVQVRGNLLALDVHLQDLDAIIEFRQRDDHLAVEAAGAQQRRIEDVGAVRRRHHDDAFGGLEAVHLGEHLVERLLTLVVTAAEACASLAADRVDLVDEDDGLAGLAGGFEQVADSARTDTDEHLHEVRTGDGHERDAGFTGDRSGDQRLTGTRGTDEQDALGDPGADACEALGLLEEVDDLGDLLLDACVTGNVVEGRAGAFGGVRLGLGAADRHDAAHLALRPALHPPEEADEQGDGQQQGEERAEQARLRRVELEVRHVGAQQLVVVVGSFDRTSGEEALAVGQLALDLAGQVVDDSLFDGAAGDRSSELIEGHRLDRRRRKERRKAEGEQDGKQDKCGGPA